MNKMKTYAIGIDIGGGTTVIGLVEREDKKILKDEKLKTSDDKYKVKELFIEDIFARIKTLAEEHGGLAAISGIGIGAPNASYETGCIQYAPNLHKEWQEFRIAEMLRQKTGLPVYVDNDANAAALGEWEFGKATKTTKDGQREKMKNFIMITLGTGLGSGIVSEGKLIRGNGGYAGELGHVIFSRSHEARMCGCGRKGCLEAYASAKGMARTAIERLTVCSDDENSLKQLYIERKKKGLDCLRNEEYKEELLISSKDVYEAANIGNELARSIFEDTGRILGEAFADFAASFDPETIFIFGGLAKSKDLLLNPVRKHMEANLLKCYKGKVDVQLSALNDSGNAAAAVLGASALVWEGLAE